MRLKSDEFLVLAVLKHEELHGNGIMQAVYRMTKGGLMLRSAGLYGLLRRLTTKGLIAPVKRPHAQPDRPGQRTYYRITSQGRRVVEVETDARARGQ